MCFGPERKSWCLILFWLVAKQIADVHVQLRLFRKHNLLFAIIDYFWFALDSAKEFSSLSILVGTQVEKQVLRVEMLMMTVAFLFDLVVTWIIARHTRRLFDLQKEKESMQCETMIYNAVQCNVIFYCKRHLAWSSLLSVLEIMCKIDINDNEYARNEWKKNGNFQLAYLEFYLFTVSLNSECMRSLAKVLVHSNIWNLDHVSLEQNR